jgi:hypothetical protein
MTQFDLGLWCFTFVVLVTGSAVLAFSDRRSREMDEVDGEVPILLTIQDAFLVTCGALLQQGT